jgi:hypothetical protein
MVGNLAKEFTTFINFVQPQRSHEETMEYLEEVLEKSWKQLEFWRLGRKRKRDLRK